MKVNALAIRQSFGEILKKLEALEEPIIIEKSRQPVAVLISMKVFEKQFVDLREKQKKEALLQEFKESRVLISKDPVELLRELRYGSSRLRS